MMRRNPQQLAAEIVGMARARSVDGTLSLDTAACIEAVATLAHQEFILAGRAAVADLTVDDLVDILWERDPSLSVVRQTAAGSL